jgi:hypothetical protein
MNFNDFSQDPQTTADNLKGWFIERTALTTAKIAEASGQVYYRQTADKFIEDNAYYALLDTIKETVKETNEALDINMGSNKNGNLTGWAKFVFTTGLTHGIVKFAKKALEYSAK